ncbi:NAD-dependent epimerase/dehydratase family protein [Streptomyces erythrochromogenes]|uniref:NAD-dependent epimerase/dehydratase family protein n=1 Tax=Streptomyces erythrochromogenes TaxID=285574 RepID=UPI00368EC618
MKPHCTSRRTPWSPQASWSATAQGSTVGCAAKIIVPESVAEPVMYYRENVTKGLSLVESLLRNGCTRFVFSSSAAIYASGQGITEDSPITPGSPYARTKAVFEGALEDITGGTDLRAVSLRYFNPIGADPKFRSGLQVSKPTHALGVMIDKSTSRPWRAASRSLRAGRSAELPFAVDLQV